jgi:WD40 repeat protein
MFDLQQPGKRVLLKDHPNAARTAFSPDGRLIATSTWHGTGVKVWDSQSGQSMLELPMKGSAAVAFSPNGRWLVTGSADEYRFWEVGSWRPGLALPRDRAGDMWGSIVFSRDGTLLALLHGRARGLQLLDAVNRRELAMIDAGKPLCFSPDGSQLVAAGHDGGVQVWDLRLIRQQLATMRLDWDLPPYPSMGPAPAPTAQKVTLINVPNY